MASTDGGGEARISAFEEFAAANQDATGVIFGFLTFEDALPVRAASRTLCGAVAQHPWTAPVPPPAWLVEEDTQDRRNCVCSPVALARWRACFPAARTLLLNAAPWYHGLDAALATAAGWELSSAYIYMPQSLTAAALPSLAALSGSALTALSLAELPQLRCAEILAALAGSTRLRTLRLVHVGRDELRVADLPCVWRNSLVTAELGATAGVVLAPGDDLRASLANVRELTLWLPRDARAWPAGAFRGLRRLEVLSLGFPRKYLDSGDYFCSTLRGTRAASLFDGVPASLRRVELRGFELEWAADEEPDGGAALLAPLAHVPDVEMYLVTGVGDEGICQLVGATRLVLDAVYEIEVGPALDTLRSVLRDLTVRHCYELRGDGLPFL
jgi:hypothetical protein